MSKKPKTKVYIDGSNVFYTQKKLGWTLDWAKVKNFFETDRDILEWKYYSGIRENDEKMLKYFRYLNALEFILISKPLKKIQVKDFQKFPEAQPSGYIFKSNFDVEMSLDMVLDKADFSDVILFSGDSDFDFTVKKLRDLGKNTIVVSSKKTLSWELKLACAKVLYLEDLKPSVIRDK